MAKPTKIPLIRCGVTFLKLVMVLFILVFSQVTFAEGNKCDPLFSENKNQPQFENGHNTSLRQVMIRMGEYQAAIETFVTGLDPVIPSKYLKDRSGEFRNPEALENILDIAHKYQKIWDHLVEHSEGRMMTARIESIPQERRAQYIKEYRQAYVRYSEGFKKVVAELESFKSQDPSLWNNKTLKDVLMNLHTEMGAAHNKF